jgi:ectoine hydroxylase-related dioxygenase (phytanoyl-CoA dioxygenase family)
MDQPLRRLSDDEIRAYDEHGVVQARGLFPEPWLERMAKAVDRAVARPTPMGQAISMKDQGFAGDAFLWKSDDDFRDWVYDSPAALVAQQVLRSKRVRHFYDQLFVKPAGCHVPTPWHHDVTFWPVDIECRNLCSIWITFDRVTRESRTSRTLRRSTRTARTSTSSVPTSSPATA